MNTAHGGRLATFEGAYRANGDEVGPQSRFECKICWWVYDPAVGDDQWQIAPGTPFTQLPSHWRCPNCDCEADQFLLLPGEEGVA